jgi:superfamily I DNA/RNA helicase
MHALSLCRSIFRKTIVVSTMHSAKGREFRCVALFRLHHPNTSLAASRHLVYVGMTRTTEQLTVVSRTGQPLTDDLEAAHKAFEPSQ